MGRVTQQCTPGQNQDTEGLLFIGLVSIVSSHCNCIRLQKTACRLKHFVTTSRHNQSKMTVCLTSKMFCCFCRKRWTTNEKTVCVCLPGRGQLDGSQSSELCFQSRHWTPCSVLLVCVMCSVCLATCQTVSAATSTMFHRHREVVSQCQQLADKLLTAGASRNNWSDCQTS